MDAARAPGLKAESPTLSRRAAAEPIAIVGIGCRFPGGANSPKAFWDMLKSGRDGISEVPKDRWNIERFFSPDASKPSKMYVRKGGFLQEPVDAFDAFFFGISPREAIPMDPQQRLLLEVTWEAFEDAGIVPSQLAGSDTGVYVGGFTLDSLLLQMSPLNRENIATHSATGASMTMLSNRISYCFDFRGPSVSMDTACSSSLVAFHHACQALWRGECSLAVAGGVNVMLRPEYPIVMCKGQFLSPDGYCKSFDERADGYSRGEGAGIVVLKPLSVALRDCDEIYALVRGTGINQDGRTDGITVPNPDAQEALIRDVYSRAKVPLGNVRYVEAHGTGTAVGDPIEASVLGKTMGVGREKDDTCVIGSVKANIGHLEAAAGIAGVIKACLCLRHRQIPPQANLKKPNPKIPFRDLGLRLPKGLEPVPERDGPVYIGVNSFGYGGTNAHAILEGLPAKTPPYSAAENDVDRPYLLALSARNEKALGALALAYVDRLTQPGAPTLKDMCYSANTRRAHHDHRLALTGESSEQVIQVLRDYVEHGRGEHLWAGKIPASGPQPNPVFVFTGMGPQWWAMGRELLEHEAVFREEAERIDAIFERIAGWSILSEMRADENHSRVSETQIAQPANFLLQAALSALWRAWGVEPGAIVGHSVGEVSAAYVAGVLTLQDAVRVSYHRSRLQKTAAGKGRMLAVGLTATDAGSLLSGCEDKVSIAAVNSPSAVTLAGDADTLEGIAAQLEQRGVFNRLLQVEVPYHSPHMDALKPELREALRELRTRGPTTPLYSTVTGRLVEAASYDAEYWCANIRRPVLFADATSSLIEQGYRLFLEVGPHPVLSTSIKECLARRGAEGNVFTSLRRQEPERTTMLMALGGLYTHGYDVDWHRLYPKGRVVSLPAYPWQRERYWPETEATAADRLGSFDHPLLGMRVPDPVPTWEGELNPNYVPYLEDHVIEDMAVFPAAAYVEQGFAIHSYVDGAEAGVLEDLEFHRALVVSAREATMLRAVYDDTTREYRVYGRPGGQASDWTLHAGGRISPAPPCHAQRVELDRIRNRCSAAIDTDTLYSRLSTQGLNYGPWFQRIRRLWRRAGEALAELHAHDDTEANSYHLHPTLLDASIQSLVATLDDDEDGSHIYLPVGIDRVLCRAPVRGRCWSHGRLARRSKGGIQGDVILCDDRGEVLAEVIGLRCQAVASAKNDRSVWLGQRTYKLTWEEAESPPPAREASSSRWLLFVDQGGVGEALASQLQARGAAEVIQIAVGESRDEENGPRFRIPARDKQAIDEMVAKMDAASCQGVVYLWGLDTSIENSDPADAASTIGCMHLLQSLTQIASPRSPHVYLVTRGARAAKTGDKLTGLAQAPIAGLGQVASSEHPDLRCTVIDLDPASNGDASQRLLEELLADSAEDDVALRGSERYVHRLVRTSVKEIEAESEHNAERSATDGHPFKLEVGAPGRIEGLRFREVRRRTPGPGEVEVKIHAAALNFKDVLKVMGILPEKALESTFHGTSLGMEASGVISQVGEGVQGYRVGDDVVASIRDSFSSHVTVPVEAMFSIHKPDHLSYAEAASIPVIFLTAYYGLHEVARLSAGETVLIHAAAGGVGLAAIQVAQWLGAEIFATAGSDEKRDYVRSLGVKHVLDSRSLSFADEIMALTDGRGVDVVLNSLSGEALFKSLSVVAPLGRFVEIGKRDIVENTRMPMRPFNRTLSFTAIDLDRMMVERPELINRLLNELAERLSARDFTPPPLKLFPAAEISDAVRYMAHSKQIGKIVISMEDVEAVSVLPPLEKKKPLRSDATYLVTGGFGGFGLEVAQSLATQGVRHLALVGRRGAAAPEARRVLRHLEGQAVHVKPIAADIGQESQVAELMDDIMASMPPLRGVIHAAAVLDDAWLVDQDEARLSKVMAPKARGAWLLHKYTQATPLDFFILFSSISALVGNPGQGNYVAANVFLDALAHHRRALGLPATSINWGALAEVGMAAKNNEVAEQLSRGGINAFTPTEATEALSWVLKETPVQIGVMDVEWTKWRQLHPVAASSPKFSHLVVSTDGTERGGAVDDLRANLMSQDPEQRQETLALVLAELIAETLRMPTDKVDINQPLTEMGIDSLMAVELQTGISANFGIEVPVLELVKGDSIAGIAAQFLGRMGLSSEGDGQGVDEYSGVRSKPEVEAPAGLALNSVPAEATLANS